MDQESHAYQRDSLPIVLTNIGRGCSGRKRSIQPKWSKSLNGQKSGFRPTVKFFRLFPNFFGAIVFGKLDDFSVTENCEEIIRPESHLQRPKRFQGSHRRLFQLQMFFGEAVARFPFHWDRLFCSENYCSHIYSSFRAKLPVTG